MFKLLKKKSQPLLPTQPVSYPIGTAVKTEKGYFYIKTSNRRLRIPSQRVLDSWKFHRVVETTEVAVTNYKISGRMGFRTGSLLYNLATGKMYLLENNELRHIESPDFLELIGAVYDDAVVISDEETKLHDEGLPLR
jgi:hypothetical protein